MGLLQLSSHARFVGSAKILYHSLFGNACALDADLLAALTSLRTPEPEEQLRSMFGAGPFAELYRNYFLVEYEGLERAIVEQDLKKRESLLPNGYFLESLQISSSNLCNFACSYCFADASDKRSARRTHISKHEPTLAVETAVRAIDQVLALARKHGRSAIGVKFLGREPLINWRTMHRLFERYRDGSVQWAVTTNGSLITAEIAKRLAEHKVMVVVSLDGPPETNNALRLLKTEGSSFHLCERGIQLLASSGARFGISSVISNLTNFRSFLGFVQRVAEFGATELELTLAMQTSVYRAQAHDAGTSALEDFLCKVYARGRQLGMMVHGDWVDPFHRILVTRRRREDAEILRPVPPGCSATSHQISLESNGDLFPCRAMSTHYGHIDDLEAALSSDAYRSVGMRTLCNVPFCKDCELEGFCQGTCLGSCEEAHGDIYSPQEEYCGIYRRMTEKLLSTYVKEKENENRNTLAACVG